MMKYFRIILFFACVFLGTDSAWALCVDFDGDGHSDSCGPAGDVPMSTGIERVDIGSSSGATGIETQAQQAPAHKVHHSSTPSMKSMVATTIMGSVLERVFSDVSSSPQPQVSLGPTPEQIQAQKVLEAQQRALEEQRRLEFQRSKNDLKKRLKGGPAYVEDKDVTETGGLKMKPLPSSTVSVATHGDFFGIAGSVRPTVELLREPMADGRLENVDRSWVTEPQRVIEQRIDTPNKWAGGIYASLRTNVPPVPYKKFNEVQPGDVFLIDAAGASKAIKVVDNILSGAHASTASHTVLFLRTVNGVKHFLENVPGEGPRIIFENEFLQRYASRGAQMAKLAQPLNAKEAKELYSAAVEMAAKNRKDVVGSTWFGTNYGAWGKDNVVCSEADWALLNIVRKEQIPETDGKLKSTLGIDFSPADFFNKGQYFLVSRVDLAMQQFEPSSTRSKINN